MGWRRGTEKAPSLMEASIHFIRRGDLPLFGMHCRICPCIYLRKSKRIFFREEGLWRRRCTLSSVGQFVQAQIRGSGSEMPQFALLFQWNWRFSTEENALSKRVIRLKYGVEEGGWFTRDGRGAYGVGLWKEIRKEVALLKEHSVREVGNGKQIRFWEDIWCGLEPLCRTFLTLSSLSVSKGAVAADFWDQWNLYS